MSERVENWPRCSNELPRDSLLTIDLMVIVFRSCCAIDGFEHLNAA